MSTSEWILKFNAGFVSDGADAHLVALACTHSR